MAGWNVYWLFNLEETLRTCMCDPPCAYKSAVPDIRRMSLILLHILVSLYNLIHHLNRCGRFTRCWDSHPTHSITITEVLYPRSRHISMNVWSHSQLRSSRCNSSVHSSAYWLPCLFWTNCYLEMMNLVASYSRVNGLHCSDPGCTQTEVMSQSHLKT
jgi:hypothetical protein